MVKWTINFRGTPYTVFIFDKEFKPQRESTQVKKDKLKDKIRAGILIFDPRHGSLGYVGMEVKDKYQADLLITQLFPSPEYTIERKGLDWSKVLEKPKPDILYKNFTPSKQITSLKKAIILLL